MGAILGNCQQILRKMKHYKPFQFKQFSVTQTNAAMKVGTDSVLLGAWAKINPKEHVLDIGTGTGILSLMLAQKVNGNCKIEAIEIENSAIIDAQINFKNSKWSASLNLIENDFNLYKFSTSYDVIISNPPFFEGLAPTHKSRSTARNASDKLSYKNLISKASQLLKKSGRIYLVIPMENYEKVIQLASNNGLELKSKLSLRPKLGKAVNRVLIELVKEGEFSGTLISNELIIRNEENIYTCEHRLLTKEYYLLNN